MQEEELSPGWKHLPSYITALCSAADKELFNIAFGDKTSEGEINESSPCVSATTIILSGFDKSLTLTEPFTSKVLVGVVVLIPTCALTQLQKVSADNKKVFVFMVKF